MKVWITCFILLFGTAELLQWFKQFSLPLPIFILGGAFLAVASNYDKLKNLPFHLDYEKPESRLPDPTPDRSVVTAQSGSQKPSASISFEIRKPFAPGD